MYKTLSDPHVQSYPVDGPEFDFSIPDNMAVSSPGGIDSITGHWTHGMYGRANSSSDWFAGQGQAYISGNFGNMYQPGQTSTYEMSMYPQPSDLPYWSNMTPQAPSPYGSNFEPSIVPPTSYQDPRTSSVFPTSIPSTVENFTPSADSVPLISPEKLREVGEEIKKELPNLPKVAFISRTNPLVIMVLLLIVFIVFDMWSIAGQLFISQHFHGGKKPSWKNMLLYAVIVTGIFAFFLWLSGAKITELESL